MGVPVNAVTGKFYNGINSIILSMKSDELSSDGDSRWATRKQAESQGWSIKSDEKPTEIYICLFLDVKDKAGKKILNRYGEVKKSPFSKKFEVYHASQIRGIPKQIRCTSMRVIKNEKIEEIIFNASVRLMEGGREAYYDPRTDLIRMPYKRAFKDTEGYYSTLLHELSHWSGHPSRLDRFDTYSRSSQDYAREELAAEIASMFLSAETGLRQTPEHFANHASYVASWISLLEADPNTIFIASAEAKKAADFILSFKNDEFEKKLAG